MARVYMSDYEAHILLAALKEYAAEASACERYAIESMIDRIEGCMMLQGQGKRKTATMKVAAESVTD